MDREKKSTPGTDRLVVTNREERTNEFLQEVKKINRVTYLVETGETPLLLCGLWFSRWLVKRMPWMMEK
jgi:hypothetical protein